MIGMVLSLIRWFIAQPRNKDLLRLENIALRHQISVLLRQKPTPRFRISDRWLWTTLQAVWPHWRSAL
jgi:hypothetical protein